MGTIQDIFTSNIRLLLFLYFIQGLPYGFQSRFMPIFLRKKGHSLTNIGFFKLLLVPWLCKALWAPLVDIYSTKHRWLYWSIFGLTLTCFVGCFVSPDDFIPLCVVVFLLNLFAATQDIAVDSIAIAILREGELGLGNTAQVVGYKIGSIFGGGVLVWLIDSLGWVGLFVFLTILYLEAFLFTFLSPVLNENQKLTVNHSEIVKRIEREKNASTDENVLDTSDGNCRNRRKHLHSVRKKYRSRNRTIGCEADIENEYTQRREEDSSESEENTNSDGLLISKKKDLNHKIKSDRRKFADTSDNQTNLIKDKMEQSAMDSGGNDNSINYKQGNQEDFHEQLIDENNDGNKSTVDIIDKEDLSIIKEYPIADSSTTCDNICTISNSNSESFQKEEEDNNDEHHSDESHTAKNQVLGNSTSATEDEIIVLPCTDESSSNLDVHAVDGPTHDEAQAVENEDESSSISQSEKASNEDLSPDEESADFADESESQPSDTDIGISDEDDSDTSSINTWLGVHEGGQFSYLRTLLGVPGTSWMVAYVLFYKLGEQGALGMLPLYLVDKEVSTSTVTFWTGIVGQATSIVGSVLGGYALSKYGLPSYMLLQQLSLCRLMPLGLLLSLITLWELQIFPALPLLYGAVLAMNVLLFISGLITTVTFTFMMQCSKRACGNMQATHYTFLATLEVAGKLTFMSLVGWCVDVFGYQMMFLSFIILAVTLLPLLAQCPYKLRDDIIMADKKDD